MGARRGQAGEKKTGVGRGVSAVAPKGRRGMAKAAPGGAASAQRAARRRRRRKSRLRGAKKNALRSKEARGIEGDAASGAVQRIRGKGRRACHRLLRGGGRGERAAHAAGEGGTISSNSFEGSAGEGSAGQMGWAGCRATSGTDSTGLGSCCAWAAAGSGAEAAAGWVVPGRGDSDDPATEGRELSEELSEELDDELDDESDDEPEDENVLEDEPSELPDWPAHPSAYQPLPEPGAPQPWRGRGA